MGRTELVGRTELAGRTELVGRTDHRPATDELCASACLCVSAAVPTIALYACCSTVLAVNYSVCVWCDSGTHSTYLKFMVASVHVLTADKSTL